MATIDLGSFAAVAPQPEFQPTRIDKGALSETLKIGESQTQLGNQMEQTGFGLAQDVEQKHNQQVDETIQLNGAKATGAAMDHRIALAGAAQQFKQNLSTGDQPWASADKDWQDVSSKIQVDPPPNLTPVQQEVFARQLKQNASTETLGVQEAAFHAKQSDYTVQAQNLIGQFGKSAAMATSLKEVQTLNDQMIANVQPMLKNFGDAATTSKVLQDAKDNNIVGFVSNQFIQARDDLPALKQFEKDLTDPKGAYANLLAPDKQNMLQKEAETRIDTLENKITIANDKRENLAITETNSYLDAAVVGPPLTAARKQDLIDTAKGTGSEAAAKNAIAIGDEIQTVRRQPFAMQRAYLQKAESDLQSTPSDDPKRDAMLVTSIQKMVDGNIKLAKENPMQLLENTTGSSVPPIDMQGAMQSGGVGKVVAQLGDRYAQLQALQKQYGPEVTLNPWHTQEQAVLAETFTKLPNDKAKLELLGGIAQAAGKNMQAYKDTIAPLLKDDRDALLAGIFQKSGYKDANGNEVAPLILRGAAALKDKNISMPPNTHLAAYFDAKVGTAYPVGSQARADAYTAFKDIYAGTIQASNKAGTETLDKPHADFAISRATGGIGNFNGSNVAMPYGMKEQDFRDKADAQLQVVYGAHNPDPTHVRDLITSTKLEQGLYADGSIIPGAYHLVVGRTVQRAPDSAPLWILVK